MKKLLSIFSLSLLVSMNAIAMQRQVELSSSSSESEPLVVTAVKSVSSFTWETASSLCSAAISGVQSMLSKKQAEIQETKKAEPKVAKKEISKPTPKPGDLDRRRMKMQVFRRLCVEGMAYNDAYIAACKMSMEWNRKHIPSDSKCARFARRWKYKRDVKQLSRQHPLMRDPQHAREFKEFVELLKKAATERASTRHNIFKK